MNTTTTTTSRDALRAIMLRAWDIRRAAAAEASVRVSDVDFSACLRMAWNDCDGARRAQARADAVRREWDALTPEEQQKLVNAAVCKDARVTIGRSVEDKYAGYWEIPAFAWAGAVSLEDVQQEAFCRVLESFASLRDAFARRAARGLYTKNMFGVVWGAVHSAVSAVYREQARAARACVRDYVDEDGARRSFVEDFCPAANDTAAEAVYSYAVEEWLAKRDAKDRAIVRGLLADLTTRDIGAGVGLSHVAVVKRVKKMRLDAAAAGLCGRDAAEAARV